MNRFLDKIYNWAPLNQILTTSKKPNKLLALRAKTSIWGKRCPGIYEEEIALRFSVSAYQVLFLTALADLSEVTFKGNKSLGIFGRDGCYNTVSNALLQMRKNSKQGHSIT
jgi:hypothetical protein